MARSRYLQTPTVQDFSKKDPRDPSKTEPQHYLTWDLPLDFHGYAQIDLIGTDDYFEYAWQRGDRLDHLAKRFYDDEQYGWVIALVNAISYPFGIKEGTILRIPTDVNTVLTKLELI